MMKNGKTKTWKRRFGRIRKRRISINFSDRTHIHVHTRGVAQKNFLSKIENKNRKIFLKIPKAKIERPKLSKMRKSKTSLVRTYKHGCMVYFMCCLLISQWLTHEKPLKWRAVPLRKVERGGGGCEQREVEDVHFREISSLLPAL